MNKASTTPTKLALAIALVTTAALSGGTNANAYTVVTRDGHIIQTQARPEIRGLQALMRLTPHGQLAVIQEEMIDWARTDAINPISPAPAAISLPDDVKTTQRAPESAPARPIRMKILGNSPSKSTSETPTTPAETQNAQQTATTEGSADQKKINAQEAIIKLQKEYAQVNGLRASAAEKKQVLEAELADLQSKQVGYASEDSSSAKRIRELQQEISAASEEIGRCESRLNDIRAEAVQLGGSID
ncbi:MAG TPA: hypothetical protein VFE84_00120 [Patescibacteria group bacterium]|nr:hypothetical protein [Patescibacteria group bacterium]